MTLSSLLKERVTIEYLTTSDDGYGGVTQSWEELATVFAQVEPIYSIQSEDLTADQRLATAGYRVRMRLRGDVEASMRLIWKTHTLLIHSIHEQGEALSLLTYEERL